MISHAIRCVLMAACICGLSVLPAAAAELVLFEAAGCVWCEAWNAEIGMIYPKAAESRVAPLRRVDVHGERPPDLASVRGIIYTPTFVLMDSGKEVGRITGYAGEESFWGLLEIELRKLDDQTPNVAGASEAGRLPTVRQGE